MGVSPDGKRTVRNINADGSPIGTKIMAIEEKYIITRNSSLQNPDSLTIKQDIDENEILDSASELHGFRAFSKVATPQNKIVEFNTNDIDYNGNFHTNEGYNNQDFKDRMLSDQSVNYTRERNVEDLGSLESGSPDYVSPNYVPVSPDYVPVSPDYVSPDYVSPDYVSPDYVSPDYVSPDYGHQEEKKTSKKINIDEIDNDLNLKILNFDEDEPEVIENSDIKII
jgi:hypothetical protein